MSQEQVRTWWNRNPMSYDVDDPIGDEHGTAAYFRELDSRVFHPRVLRLTSRPGERPFSRFVDFDALGGMETLEVGCGSGFAAQLMAEAGANVVAVDLTPWAVETTRKRFEAFGLRAEIREADAEELPFENDRFDLVFSWGVIHHTTDMNRALGEIVRVCKPGGRVILMLYHRRSFFFAFYRGLARFLPLARRLGLHFEGARAGEREGLIARHFNIPEIRRLLADAGLQVETISPYGQDSELLPLPRRVRVPITDRIPLGAKDWLLNRWGHQLGIVARKRGAPS
jgi:2-polyprenyl-3-methyl-5-hydroxy-6-metoxy-1,4-benzoquinol methylase